MENRITLRPQKSTKMAGENRAKEKVQKTGKMGGRGGGQIQGEYLWKEK
jgi:hypothetical protein